MMMDTSQQRASQLPVRRTLTLAYASSLAVAALMAAASVAGILLRSSLYPTEELLQSAVPTDVANLGIGLPLLLVSLWLARQGRLAGLLLWPGALFYVFYTYTVTVLSMPLNWALLLHLALVTLSAYTMAGLVYVIDGAAVRRQLSGMVHERLAGAILAVLGLAFGLLAVGGLVGALVSGTPVARNELALHITDAVCAPALVIGGGLLLRREALGYVVGLGLLFQTSMLFIGLIVLMLVQPWLTEDPLAVADVVVVALLGLICFIPFGLFLRGVARSTEG
jgi:hypothetical protein